MKIEKKCVKISNTETVKLNWIWKSKEKPVTFFVKDTSPILKKENKKRKRKKRGVVEKGMKS